MAEETVGSRLSLKARELTARGATAVGALPTPEEVAAMAPDERQAVLEGLRIELYAISSVLAEGTVERAWNARAEHPPYGLVRSGHTDWRLVLASPTTVGAGAIDGFYTLGKAYVDTMVFHLAQEFAALPHAERGWMADRLEGLLRVFRVVAGPATRGRLRDNLSFIYGGLHFGTGVSVQLAEVMSRLLASYPGLTPEQKAEIMARSGRPAHRMAALNLDHVIVAYHTFLAPPEKFNGPQWFDAERFVVQETEAGRPWAIDFRPDQLVAGKPHTPRLDTMHTTYATHGCPARISPTGASPPIARLWTWAAELAHHTGLLEVSSGR